MYVDFHATTSPPPYPELATFFSDINAGSLLVGFRPRVADSLASRLGNFPRAASWMAC
jgi:hypothetical protein